MKKLLIFGFLSIFCLPAFCASRVRVIHPSFFTVEHGVEELCDGRRSLVCFDGGQKGWVSDTYLLRLSSGKVRVLQPSRELSVEYGTEEMSDGRNSLVLFDNGQRGWVVDTYLVRVSSS
ncbi:hypothetical protein HN511_04015 [bacterium]|jgi:hypothetical protein|nr:hypothetical protein [bacterium]